MNQQTKGQNKMNNIIEFNQSTESTRDDELADRNAAFRIAHWVARALPQRELAQLAERNQKIEIVVFDATGAAQSYAEIDALTREAENTSWLHDDQ
jgi:hypothetical protein